MVMVKLEASSLLVLGSCLSVLNAGGVPQPFTPFLLFLSAEEAGSLTRRVFVRPSLEGLPAIPHAGQQGAREDHV